MRFFLFLFLMFTVANANKYNSIYDAIIEAKATGKVMVYFILANQCNSCKKLMYSVNNKVELLELLDEEYITVITDIQGGGKVPVDLPFEGKTPTILLVGANGKSLVKPIVGNISGELLYEYLKNISNVKKGMENTVFNR